MQQGRCKRENVTCKWDKGEVRQLTLRKNVNEKATLATNSKNKNI